MNKHSIKFVNRRTLRLHESSHLATVLAIFLEVYVTAGLGNPVAPTVRGKISLPVIVITIALTIFISTMEPSCSGVYFYVKDIVRKI